MSARESKKIEAVLKRTPVGRARTLLMLWWETGGMRNFSWRKTRDPYKVLVSEILLHRTMASRVDTVYEKFINRYPTVNALAQGTVTEIADMLASLGLGWRWKLLHDMAARVVDDFHGEIPQSYEYLISLPGIGNYIASAVRCFAFGEAEILLDTNTIRVVGRLFGIRTNDSSRRSMVFETLLGRFMMMHRPRDFYLALIDFAAQICQPRPRHDLCPLTNHCFYYKSEDKYEN